MSAYHEPALAHKVVQLLVRGEARRYVDATIGGGGHASAILQAADPEAHLLGLDLDEEALAETGTRLAGFGDRVGLQHQNFANLSYALEQAGWDTVEGIVADLGTSFHQVDDGARGFSFQERGPLDFRMDRGQALTGEQVVNEYPEARIIDLLRSFGEEPRARRIARALVRARERQPLETTSQLAEVVAQVVNPRYLTKSLARVFQAIRIEVNGELDNLQEFLSAAHDALAPGGRVVVIAWHSLEDRMVKHFLRDREPHCTCPPDLPVCVCGTPGTMKVITRRVVRPDEDEVSRNLRSRSARLRCGEKL